MIGTSAKRKPLDPSIHREEVEWSLMQEARNINDYLHFPDLDIESLVELWICNMELTQLYASIQPSASVRERFETMMERRHERMNELMAKMYAKAKGRAA